LKDQHGRPGDRSVPRPSLSRLDLARMPLEYTFNRRLCPLKPTMGKREPRVAVIRSTPSEHRLHTKETSVSRDRTSNRPEEMRRENHLRRMLVHLEESAREAPPSSQADPQMKVPLIGLARPAKTESRRRARGKAKKPGPKAAQLDFGV
jgi:hypothetical protein